jgi:hypothetical protein
VKRLKGPELKLSGLKPPAFLADLYYDLRDRRLLPLVALVVVAIVATPILLSQKSEANPPAAGAGAIAVLKEASSKSSALRVVEATPGLRDYRKRLRGRKPTDPFHQPAAKPSLKGARLGGSKGESSAGGETRSTSTTTGESAGGSAPSGSSGGAPASGGGEDEGGGDGGAGGGDSGGAGQPEHATLYSFAIDVTIVHTSGSGATGDKQTSEPEVRKRVLPTTLLPGAKKQVVTYMGLSPKTRKPLFLVSAEVTGVFGEGKCAAGTGVCQLIELEPGFPEVFEYGEGGDRYKLNVTNVEPVVTGHV